MRDQYAGDISDVLKFAFLRVLSGSDRRLGVAWYYVPGDDGRPDGRHVEWVDEPAWRRLDSQLHAGLSSLSERTVAALELAPIWPKGTLFHRVPVPSANQRAAWSAHKRSVLEKADIVFLDPDNGLGTETAKYATLSEVQLLRKSQRAVVFITFPGRNLPHDVLVEQLHDKLRTEAGAEGVVTLRTNVSVLRNEGARSYVPRQRWFTIIDPDAALIERARRFSKLLASVPRVRARLDGEAELQGFTKFSPRIQNLLRHAGYELS